MAEVFRVPILGDDGVLPPRFIPPVPPSDPAVAQLLDASETTETKTAVIALIVAQVGPAVDDATAGMVTSASLTSTLSGYVTTGSLTAALSTFATDAEVAQLLTGKAARPFYRVVVWNGTAWADVDGGGSNPAPYVTGGARHFYSPKDPAATAPPELTGVDGDLWTAHPDSTVYAALVGA